ncbi:histidinol-phosphatase [Enterococcus ureilyticus]|uniref:Histidinol-phosphatase n=1 Tax=Enterococcus ureilyticus TaxID=1131292 RepID=A0A1E5HC58_9ENTE|nr:histidinol-phosphatase [Enterococcus ureilyticus]MBM7690555.1 ABC-type sugar transport system ATPase subunit [Enterococcus ureilyticus]OEG22541.1 histidinol-phosphatase [Enterococcus ureilyticus]
MKKIDLHIHTISTVSDSKKFLFSIKKLKEYVSVRKLDAIAITNHNTFDIDQFDQIQQELDIPVFPGVEVDLENGHILVISDKSLPNIQTFSEKCKSLHSHIKDQNSTLTLEEFYNIFPRQELKKYLLIPHYMKSPEISDSVIIDLSQHSKITTGETSSVRKFVELLNKEDDLTPVFFSDQRISEDLVNFSMQQTYINVSEITFAALKYTLSDKSKVALSLKEGKNLFNLTEKVVASTGLNVLIGERSSGKTHLLNEIAHSTNNTKYIRQFELVERSDDESRENFNRQLLRDESLFTDSFLKEFKDILTLVSSIDPKQSESNVNKYLRSLIKNAESTEKKDSFAKAKLFSETPYKPKSLGTLDELIRSVQIILDNQEYSSIIFEELPQESLIKLLNRLVAEYRKIFMSNFIKERTNSLIADIQGTLQLKTRIQRVSDIDFSDIAKEILIINEFNNITKELQKDTILDETEVYDFTIRKSKRPFKGAQEVLNIIKKQTSFIEVFKFYDQPFDYLQALKTKDILEQADFVKYFVKIQIEILNKDLNPVSGGQRAEYNFLKKIEDSLKYDLLLIDEPESSFDNMFLNSKINTVLQDISKHIPVFVSTHNNTIGASIKPDFILHTQRTLVRDEPVFNIYYGFPSDRQLCASNGMSVSNLSVQLNCLEAGEQTYKTRRDNYEILEN